MVAKVRTRSSTRRRRGDPPWVGWTDDEILDLRFKDLGVKIQGTPLEERVERLYDDLAHKGFRFRPHVWLSDEWFSPEGVPGIAIPFYLAHPRLAKLERRQMLEVEGGSERSCLRILRHEAGHTLDTAYGLSRRRAWKEIFGHSRPYPEYYKPRPYSRDFVLHLDAWYAQSHPAEDFAETFAVWLSNGNRWRRTYEGWPAMKKLLYVDRLMSEIQDEAPKIRSRRYVEPLRLNAKTLGEHYEWKRNHYGTEFPHVYDRDLKRLFSDDPKYARRETAVSFLKRVRPQVREMVAHWTGLSQYTIDQVLSEMIGRCKKLKLRVRQTDRTGRIDTTVMLTVQTMNFLHGGRHRLAL
jgi:hypothetical protein